MGTYLTLLGWEGVLLAEALLPCLQLLSLLLVLVAPLADFEAPDAADPTW